MKLVLGLAVLYGMFWGLILIRPAAPSTNADGGLRWLGDAEEPLFHHGRRTERIPLEELATADQPEELPLGYRYADDAEAEDENEDIEDPPLTWAEAHCAPKYYSPPDNLVPDRWHPANILTGAKP